MPLKINSKMENEEKKPMASKNLVSHPLQLVPSLSHDNTNQWGKKVWLDKTLNMDWVSLANYQGAHEVIEKFVETKMVVVQGKNPLDTNFKMVQRHQSYPKEMTKKLLSLMQQLKRSPQKGLCTNLRVWLTPTRGHILCLICKVDL